VHPLGLVEEAAAGAAAAAAGAAGMAEVDAHSQQRSRQYPTFFHRFFSAARLVRNCQLPFVGGVVH
jgi:hypothetical protein